jgi:CheY-like chemotaxis protein
MPYRVLIVDDEPEWQKIFEDTFVTIDFLTTTASGISAAKDALLAATYDLMVLDIFLTPAQLPLTYQGFLEFVHRSYPDMKVFATTGGPLPPNEAFELANLGVVEFIYKPQIQLDDLRMRVDRWLPGSWTGQNCSVLLTDVSAFGAPYRTDADRHAIRRALYRILKQSLTSAGISWNNCHHEDRGDGVLVVIPPAVSTRQLVHPFFARLDDSLSRHNDQADGGARFQLRAALDVGPVEADDEGVNGATLIDVARLVESRIFKQRFRAETGADLGIIISDFVYDRFIRHLPRQLAPNTYQRIEDGVKEREFTAWICIMGPARKPPES